jgi:hypothetical protein
MSIYDGLEDALSEETKFAFRRFSDAMLEDKDLARGNLRQRLQHLMEAYDVAINVLGEVMKDDDEGPA